MRSNKALRRWWRKITSRLHIQLVLILVYCTVLAGLGWVVMIPFANQIRSHSEADQSAGQAQIAEQLQYVVGWFSQTGKPTSTQIQQQLDLAADQIQVQVLITDIKGQVLYRSANSTTPQVDLPATIHQVAQENSLLGKSFQQSQIYVVLDTIVLNGQPAYVIMSGVPRTDIVVHVSPYTTLLNWIVAGLLFFGLFVLLTRDIVRDVQALSCGLAELSKGNLSFRLPEKRNDELGRLATFTNQMATELQKLQDQERRQEQLRNDLITNVSHDLRTPLTSIMGYLQLVKDQADATNGPKSRYVDIAHAKAVQLKKLIEALFEYTKLSNHVVELHLAPVSLNALLGQFIEEWRPIAEEQDVMIRTRIPAEPVAVRIDADQMVRVLENLMSNAITYSIKPDTLEVVVTKEPNGTAIITLSNRAEGLTPEQVMHLFDRFYQADAARSSPVRGAGLGLAIAKSIVELHGGAMWAELQDERLHLRIRLSLIRQP